MNGIIRILTKKNIFSAVTVLVWILLFFCGFIGPPVRAYPFDQPLNQTSAEQKVNQSGLDVTAGISKALELGGTINKMFLDNLFLPSFIQTDIFKSLMSGFDDNNGQDVVQTNVAVGGAQNFSFNDIYGAGKALLTLILQIAIAILSAVLGILRAVLSIFLNSR